MDTLTTQITVAAILGISIGAIISDLVRGWLMRIPGMLWMYLKDNFTVTISFNSSDNNFKFTNEWIAANPRTKNIRNVREEWSVFQQKMVILPSPGRYIYWFEGKPFLFYYNIQIDSSSAIARYELTFLTRKRDIVERFLKHIKSFQKPPVTRLTMYTCESTMWRYTGTRMKRSMDSMYLESGLKESLIKDFGWFIKSEEWYLNRSIPYRRGYLFYGPPGTGKTTLTVCLAGHFNKAIYIMNLNTITNDEALMKIFSSVEKDAIVLIEDVDAVHVSNERIVYKDGEGKDKVSGITLAGLLNAIDGVAATEGRILVMTTNHPDKLDPALVRSGRIDKRVRIGTLPSDEVARMFAAFFPDLADQSHLVKRFASNIIEPAASWQEFFIRNQDTPEMMLAMMGGM